MSSAAQCFSRKLSAIGLIAMLAGVLGGCATQQQPLPSSSGRQPPLQFAYYQQDGTPFNGAGTRGRVTVILLMTTYDLNSQLVARRLNDLLHTFSPRFNVGAVVLEAATYAVLVEPFKQSLGLDYPVVLADHATLQGEGPFGPVQGVPITLVLDPEGRPVFRLTGPATDKQLRRALRGAGSMGDKD